MAVDCSYEVHNRALPLHNFEYQISIQIFLLDSLLFNSGVVLFTVSIELTFNSYP